MTEDVVRFREQSITLEGADLKGANLRGANLSWAKADEDTTWPEGSTR